MAKIFLNFNLKYNYFVLFYDTMGQYLVVMVLGSPRERIYYFLFPSLTNKESIVLRSIKQNTMGLKFIKGIY